MYFLSLFLTIVHNSIFLYVRWQLIPPKPDAGSVKERRSILLYFIYSSKRIVYYYLTVHFFSFTQIPRVLLPSLQRQFPW